jgi:hypothetical protein
MERGMRPVLWRFFEISQFDENMESNNWAHFFLTHSKGIGTNASFGRSFSFSLIDLEGRRWITGILDRKIGPGGGKLNRETETEKLWAGDPLVVTVA